ncbi:MAG: trypsin-like serine protease [Myxococcota bacterium]
MWDRVLLPIATILAFVVPDSARAGDYQSAGDRERETQIFDGAAADSCQWPMVVSIGNFSICTATLVHPRLITTAAHCLEGGTPNAARFGESFNSPVANVPIEFCVSHPEYPGSNGGQIPSNAVDAAFCVLGQEVDLPLTPIPQGCELAEITTGRDAAVVGFGNSNPGASENINDDSGAGIKRFDASRIDYWEPSDQTVRADGPCQGDSGGPLMVELSDGSWRNLGMLSSGSGDCGTPVPSNYMQTPFFLEWIEENSGIDISPCYDDEGLWNPTELCGNYATDPLDNTVSWNAGCQQATTGPASTCGPSYLDAPDVDAPEVRIASPANQTPFDGSSASVQIQIDVEDAYPIKEVRLFVNGEEAGRVAGPDFVVEADFPQGQYTLSATAEDWSGNVGSSPGVNIGVGVEPEEGGSGETGDDETDAGDVGTGGGFDDGTDASDADGDGDGGNGPGSGDTDAEPGADGSGGSGGCSVGEHGSGGPTGVLLGLLLAAGAVRRRRS